MRKLLYSLLIVMIFVVSMCCLISCGEESEENDLAQVNVKFMIGEEVYATLTYTEGDTISDPNLEEYKSLIITHWTVNGTTKNAFFPYKVGKTDLTFYAYTVQAISASFNVDGVAIQTKSYTNDDAIMAPESPQKSGYRFRYWAINGLEATFPYSLANEQETKLRFDAVFEKMYTIQFVSDGTVVSSNEYLKGESIVKATEPQKENYSFIYWQDEKGNPYKDGTKVEGDATYTALFEKDFYTATYYVGSSQKLYKTLYTSGKVLDLEYVGDGNFYGWYTTKNYTKKYDFTKPITGNVSIYGKVYSTNYEIIASKGSTQKVTLPNTNFIQEAGFEDVTSAPSYITIAFTYGNVKATYNFSYGGSKVTIAYDVINSKYTNGQVLCTYGAVSQIKLTVDKYSYSAIDFTMHGFADTKTGGGDSDFNDALEKVGVYIGQKTIDYLQAIYDETKNSAVSNTGVEDPDLDYSITVTSNTKGTISASSNMPYYSLKIQNSSGDNVFYSTTGKTVNVTDLEPGTYRVIVIFENPKDSYVLRQILTSSIEVN